MTLRFLKIRYQLESQGFTNIADFSKRRRSTLLHARYHSYGMEGWVAFDKAVDPFVSNPTPAPSYNLNDRFIVRIGQVIQGS